MIWYILAQVAAAHASHSMEPQSSEVPYIPLSESRDTLVELPTRPTHHSQITTDMLAAGTITYCQRTGKTRCENEVSSLSGSTKVVVCQRGGAWWVNRCED